MRLFNFWWQWCINCLTVLLFSTTDNEWGVIIVFARLTKNFIGFSISAFIAVAVFILYGTFIYAFLTLPCALLFYRCTMDGTYHNLPIARNNYWWLCISPPSKHYLVRSMFNKFVIFGCLKWYILYKQSLYKQLGLRAKIKLRNFWGWSLASKHQVQARQATFEAQQLLTFSNLLFSINI